MLNKLIIRNDIANIDNIRDIDFPSANIDD